MTVVPNPKRYRGKKLGGPGDLHVAWMVLAGSAPDAAAALVDVANNSPVPGARVAAAKTILEMTGFKSPDTVPVLPPEHDRAGTATVGDSPADRIRNRLASLANPAPEPMSMPTLEELATQDPNVVDAVVIEVVEDQP
jgi:hypothetical protein